MVAVLSPPGARPHPACMNRSCQRHTAVLALPVRRMISAVPWTRYCQKHDLRARAGCNRHLRPAVTAT